MSVLKARIGLGSRYVDMESRGGGELALPLADVVRQLADGRVHGEFPVHGDGGPVLIRFADVTDVELTWTR